MEACDMGEDHGRSAFERSSCPRSGTEVAAGKMPHDAKSKAWARSSASVRANLVDGALSMAPIHQCNRQRMSRISIGCVV